MTYETYRYIFIIAAIAAAVFLVVTLILLFALKIPKVIGDLSGATARKAIQDIRMQNENSGERAYKSSTVNKERGRVTDKITPSGRLLTRNNTSGLGMRTEKISTQVLSRQAMEGSGETTVLSPQEMGTANETTVLNPEILAFRIERDITFIHTDEVITI